MARSAGIKGAWRIPSWLAGGSGSRGVGVLPEREEVLVGFPRLRRVARERGATRQTQVGNRIIQSPIRIEPGTTPTGALVIQDLLELGRGLVGAEIRANGG
jgi:hypothetical protein